MIIKAQVRTIYYNLTLVVFNTDNPSIPEVNCSGPDLFTIAFVVCVSDPIFKPCKKTKSKDLRMENKQNICINL